MVAKGLHRILMCAPKYFKVSYEINPWMKKTVPVDGKQAWQQWNHLRSTLEKCGATITLVEPVDGLPDMVFTANAGMHFKNKVYVSNFKHAERQGEQEPYAEWFRKNNFEVYGTTANDSENFEGAGDALMAGEKVFGAYGFRTDAGVYEKIRKTLKLDSNPFVLAKLVDPRFYHIDTCFCPITPNLAIWFPKAFAEESRKKMENEIELIAVPEKEATGFACNSVVVGKHVVMPERSSETAKLLAKRGFEVHHAEMSEFLKAGGACKCLTLTLI